jgi:hypothetical protein
LTKFYRGHSYVYVYRNWWNNYSHRRNNHWGNDHRGDNHRGNYNRGYGHRGNCYRRRWEENKRSAFNIN